MLCSPLSTLNFIFIQTSIVIGSQVQRNDIRKKKHSAPIAAWPMARFPKKKKKKKLYLTPNDPDIHHISDTKLDIKQKKKKKNVYLAK